MNQRLIVYTEHRSFDAFGQVFATAYTPNINLDLDSLPGTDRKYSSFGSSFTHLITVSRTTSKLEFSGLLSHEVIRPDRSLLRTLNGLGLESWFVHNRSMAKKEILHILKVHVGFFHFGRRFLPFRVIKSTFYYALTTPNIASVGTKLCVNRKNMR